MNTANLLLPKTKVRPSDTWLRVLLFIFIASFPIQEDIPTIAGASLPFLMLALIALHVLFTDKLLQLKKILSLPFAKVIYLYILYCIIIETFHPFNMYTGIFRMLMNFFAAFLVAACINSKKDLKAVILGYIFSGVLTALIYIIYGWSGIQAQTSSFLESDLLRSDVLSKLPISQNTNTLAYTFSVAIIIILISVYTKAKMLPNKALHYVLMGILFLGAIIAMSRSGIFILIVTTFFLAIYFKLFNFKMLLLGFFILVIGFALTPDSFKERMIFKTGQLDEYGNRDSRSVVLDQATQEVQKNYLIGVGEGNFWKGDYARQSSLAKYDEARNKYSVYGSHNLLLQNIIQWGIGTMIFYVIMHLCILKMLPPRHQFNFLTAVVVAVNISAILLLFFNHESANKEYCIAYGLLIAYHLKGKK